MSTLMTAAPESIDAVVPANIPRASIGVTVSHEEGAQLRWFHQRLVISRPVTAAQRAAHEAAIRNSVAADSARVEAAGRAFVQSQTRLPELKLQHARATSACDICAAKEHELATALRNAVAAGRGIDQAESAIAKHRADAGRLAERRRILGDLIAEAQHEMSIGLKAAIVAERDRIAAESIEAENDVAARILAAVDFDAAATLERERTRRFAVSENAIPGRPGVAPIDAIAAVCLRG